MAEAAGLISDDFAVALAVVCSTAMGGPDADRTPDDGADALLQGIKQALKCAI